MRAIFVVLLAMELAACNNPEDSGAPAPGDPAVLCVNSLCGTKTALVTIPDAENLWFTSDGRLFVSGGTNVYEITRVGEQYSARAMLVGECNFTGLAQRGAILYAACGSDRRLYAAVLNDAPQLVPIYALEGMSLPNGMATGPDDELYIVDGPLSGSSLPSPKIVRLKFAEGNPAQVIEQLEWLDSGLQFPNGITRIGRTLYVTDGRTFPPSAGVIRAVQILDNGMPGPPMTLGTFATILDDLSPVGDHLLVAEFSRGSIALVGPDGAVVDDTAPGSFDNPSAVRVGVPPLFEPTDILVTEKGALMENDSPIGNVLSVFRPDPVAPAP